MSKFILGVLVGIYIAGGPQAVMNSVTTAHEAATEALMEIVEGEMD